MLRKGRTRVFLSCYRILLLDLGDGYISVVLYALSICVFFIIKSCLFVYGHAPLSPDRVLKYYFPL